MTRAKKNIDLEENGGLLGQSGKMKVTEDTPLIKQFFEVKAKFPGTVLLYRVGDFYETYSDDALTASKVLGIVLTKRSNGDKEPLPMAGFPYHAIDTYLPKLVQAGYKVAVCDQLEDPKTVGRKLVKRGVSEIVTPGVAFSDDILRPSENNYLAGLYFDKEQVGIAFVDVSTGGFSITQGSTEYISSLLSSFGPKEVIVPRQSLRQATSAFGSRLYYSTMDEWAFVYDSAAEKLIKQLDTGSLRGFGIEQYPLGICCAGAILAYLEHTGHPALQNICSISRIDRDEYVWMDEFTRRNLEIFRCADGSGQGTLLSVMDSTRCPMGARLLRHWLAMPVLSAEELRRRYDVVEFFAGDDDTRAALRALLGNVGDLERIISRAGAGKIMPKEVLQLGRGLAISVEIRKLCLGKNEAADAAVQRLSDKTDLTDLIRRTISEETAPAVGKGDVIAAGVSAELDELRSIASGGKDYLLAMQQHESEKTGIPSLKISYNNVFGYYLEVRNTYKDKVPPEWIRKQTLVNAERYITEELKEYENRILGAEDRIRQIEADIYGKLVAEIQRHIPGIQADASALARLDVLSSFAENAVRMNYCRPEINSGNSLEIKEGRHPVIETMMPSGEQYVPNDVTLDPAVRQIIILTGPNMAGKSALLRQTALIVLMAQTGSFVPAKAASIGLCDKIFTRVGASDNISRGESTFMVEMIETSMILHNLSEKSLVLLDEIGRGTATYDGMSIARAIVEYIHGHGKGAKTLFATHYHELNDLADIYPRISNFHIAVKEHGKDIIFLRKLVPGGAEHSFGIHVARLAGMPAEVLEAAEKTLKSLEKGRKDIPASDTDGLQLSLFQLDDPTLSSIRQTLRKVDLNNMTPLQAFDLIREMKKELGI